MLFQRIWLLFQHIHINRFLFQTNEDGNVDEVLLFHGSSLESIQSIAMRNFQVDTKPSDGQRSKSMLFGSGIYFSQLPFVSLVYGTGLILCKVLTGKTEKYFPNGSTPPEINQEVDTRIVMKDNLEERFAKV